VDRAADGRVDRDHLGEELSERGLVEPSVRREASDLDWVPPSPPDAPGGDGWEGGGSWPPVSNARLGMWMLILAEVMFFGGMVAAFLMLRMNATEWPPAQQPRLPVGVTAVNTAVLLASSATLARALRAVRAGERRGLTTWLGRTALLGSLFLLVQGAEWGRMVGFGLTVSSGAYGATFYTLIGTHGAHVLGALAWLALVRAAAVRGRYTARDHVGVATCAMYWHFVVALWPILYLLVYLL
jgi:heme/copper-type cytochrome/quinol oxidase subunit 3